jgi:hypothetical protein
MGKHKADSPPDTDLLPGISDDLGSELLESPEIQATKYTGKIVEQNQARVEGILASRAIGIPLRKIMKAFTVSAHTIAEIEHRHAAKLATVKERLARKFGVFLELGLDRCITEVDAIDIDKLMISLGIAGEKMLMLNGEPSVIFGSVDGPRKFSIDALNERLGRRDRNIIDVTPPTGSGGGEKEQTREGAGSRLAGGRGRDGAALEAGSEGGRDAASGDSQSPN